jgi:ribosomal protein S18 acetylase RimI-like enzyme
LDTSDFNIRRYMPGDEESVIRLWQKCNLTRPWNNPKADIERKLKDSPELFLVGTIGNKVAATVMCGYDGHRGWIHYLGVDPEYQRNGLGRRIMEAAAEKLKEKGCPKINLNVRKTNSEVIQFYNKIGYGEDEVITMSKRLIVDEPFDKKH